jgi:hypothetical protein
LGGNKWSEIAREWLDWSGTSGGGRNELQIKNRFKCLIKKEGSGDSKEQIIDRII